MAGGETQTGVEEPLGTCRNDQEEIFNVLLVFHNLNKNFSLFGSYFLTDKKEKENRVK